MWPLFNSLVKRYLPTNLQQPRLYVHLPLQRKVCAAKYFRRPIHDQRSMASVSRSKSVDTSLILSKPSQSQCNDSQQQPLLATLMAGSSMRLVRLKPKGPGPIGARTAQYNEHLQSRTTLGPEISREKICSLLKKFCLRGARALRVPQSPRAMRGPQSLSCLRARRDHDLALGHTQDLWPSGESSSFSSKVPRLERVKRYNQLSCI